MAKIVVYTVCTNRRCQVIAPRDYNPNFDYVAFVDETTDPVPEPYEARPVHAFHPEPRRNARYHKIMAHELFPDHIASVWHDGAFQVVNDLVPLLDVALSEHDFAAFPHYERDCIYDEINVIRHGRFANSLRINEQKRHYRGIGHPERGGLIASGILLRMHHAPVVRDVQIAWWGEIERFSVRDQVSFPVVARQHHMAYYEIPGNMRDNAYFCEPAYVERVR